MAAEDETDKGGSIASVWDLVVFQKVYQAALAIHRAAMRFPKHERFELASQIRRSSKGICANLSEGRGRQQGSRAEFRRFALMALGSTDETLLWCGFAKYLGYLDDKEHAHFEAVYGEIARMLNSLISKLRRHLTPDT